MEAKKRAVTVHKTWMRALPGRGRAFWQEVGREVRRRGIRAGDVGRVLGVARELEERRVVR